MFKPGQKVEFITNWSYPIPLCETACPEVTNVTKGEKATILEQIDINQPEPVYSVKIAGRGKTGLVPHSVLKKVTVTSSDTFVTIAKIASLLASLAVIYHVYRTYNSK